MKTAKEFFDEMMEDTDKLKVYGRDEWDALSSGECNNYWSARYAYYWEARSKTMLRQTAELTGMSMEQAMQWGLLYNVREIVEVLNRGLMLQVPPTSQEPWEK